MDEKKLEDAFNRLCADAGLKKGRDLWPQVRLRTAAAGPARPPRRARWALAAAGAALAVILVIPGVSQSIMTRLAKLFSSKYSISVGGAEYKGVLVSVEGELRELKAGDRLVQVKVSAVDESTVKVALRVYSRARKLQAKPVIVSMVGKPLEIRIAGADGSGEFLFRMVPLEKQPGVYDAFIYQLPDAVLDQADALKRQTLNTEAMYWAWRISVKHDVTYEQFEKYAYAWDVKPDTRDLLLSKIRELVASGRARKLDAQEEQSLKDSEARLAALTAGAPRLTADLKRRLAAADKIMLPVADTEAMYWAWRVAGAGDLTYEELRKDSANWLLSEEAKETLLKKIKIILDAGKARPLTPEEEARYQRALDKVKTAGR